MITEQLLKNGISEEDLDSFAKLPLHNGKEDILRRIIGASNDNGLDEFSKSLLEVLANNASDFNIEIPEGQRAYLGNNGCRLYLGAKVSNIMLDQLTKGKYEQYDGTLTIKVNNTTKAIGREVASLIIVKPLGNH